MLMRIHCDQHKLEMIESHKAQETDYVVSLSCVEAAWFGVMLLSCPPGKMACQDQQVLKFAGKQNLQDTGIVKLKGKQKANIGTSIDC